jgi:thymidylate synthase ThyX
MGGATEHAEPMVEVHAAAPKVRLLAYTHEPYRIAVASARTCYAKDFVFLGQMTPKGERQKRTLAEAFPNHGAALDEIGVPSTSDERRAALVAEVQSASEITDEKAAVEAFAQTAAKSAFIDDRIAASIYEAGHHTPFQHPHFVFSLEGISRNVVESFFHQHTFFNSEQQSQRYVEMGDAEVHVPASIVGNPVARKTFDDAVLTAWSAYHQLRSQLVESNIKTMGAIGRIKGQSDAQIKSEAEKKAQEMARYVIPIAAATQMYHTVSGIVLLRYIRMANAQNAHHEATTVVQQMVAAVGEVDPDFASKIQEAAHATDDLPEWQLASGDAPTGPSMGLDGTTSKLLHVTPNAGNLVAQAIREVTGTGMEDQTLLAAVLDPKSNKLWNDTLNTWDHSPVLRTLRHVHLTFYKRQSLSAVAQDQRHRLTPGTRPLLHRLVTPSPDIYTPDVVATTGGAKLTYDAAIDALWSGMHKLIELGIPVEDAAYLLPNATNQYYTQSGDLLSFIHKWRLRLCFNAQKEIFDASLDELRQAQAAIPELTRWLGPPCTFVAAAQPAEMQDDVAACCPEGPRWCGVKVWKNFDAGKGKPKRPY